MGLRKTMKVHARSQKSDLAVIRTKTVAIAHR